MVIPSPFRKPEYQKVVNKIYLLIIEVSKMKRNNTNIDKQLLLSCILISLLVYLTRKYNLIDYLKGLSFGTKTSNFSQDTSIFSQFEFDPTERFNLHDNFKYSWIACGVFILGLSISFAL